MEIRTRLRRAGRAVFPPPNLVARCETKLSSRRLNACVGRLKLPLPRLQGILNYREALHQIPPGKTRLAFDWYDFVTSVCTSIFCPVLGCCSWPDDGHILGPDLHNNPRKASVRAHILIAALDRTHVGFSIGGNSRAQADVQPRPESSS